MRLRLLPFLFVLLSLGPPLYGQVSGNITSSQCVTIGAGGATSTIGIQVTGTWSGTLQPQVTIQGQAAVNTSVFPVGSTTSQTTITANGAFTTSVAGSSTFQICGNTVASGTAVVYLNASNAAVKINGGSGSGTVTHTAGALTSNCNVIGNGSADLKCSTQVTDNGTTFNTGTETVTFPTGTSSTPGLVTTSSPVSGFGVLGGGDVYASRNSNGIFDVSNTKFAILSSEVFGWTNSNADPTANSPTTALSLIGPAIPGFLALGNGTLADDSAILRAGNACRVTTDVTLTVNTAVTVCSWSLPAVAKAWAWQCQIPWVISAGTGTNTLAIIANASQTPTAATNGTAEIKTTNTNTATEATTAISASGATTLLTSGTITPAATVFQSSTSGTLLASATAGTFSIQMTAAGTTATAAAKAGATCTLY